MTNQSPISLEELKAKSLGEKLSDAFDRVEGYETRTWLQFPDATRAFRERVALSFAASLTHDETASAVIASLTARAEKAEQRAKFMEETLSLTAALAQALAKNDRLRLGDKLVFTGEWSRIGTVSITSILDQANAALSPVTQEGK